MNAATRAARRLIAGMACAGLALSAVTDPAAAQAGRFEEFAEVVVIEVPVQVLEDGQPVRGLTADDFEILDGRKRREIIGFEVIDLSLSAAVEGPSPLIAAAARRHFLFLFDLSFSDPSTVVRAREAAIELVETGLHASDLAAVATYSRIEGVRLLLGFTPDQAQIRLAIETLGLPQLVESRRDPLGLTFTDLRQSADAAEAVGAGGPGRTGLDAEGEILEQLQSMESGERRATDRNEILALTGAMAGLAEMMKNVDGRKYVVFLSEGFDSSILLGRGVSTADDQQRIQEQSQAAIEGRVWDVKSDERFGETSTQNQLSLMLNEFVRADCTIQAVDIGGLRAGGDARPRASSEDSLFVMANSTGGELFRNFNNLNAAMGKMLERTSVTYLLAFQPEDLAYDGEFHQLKVKLKGGPKGARLVHRPGYFAPRSFGELSGVERQLTTASKILGAPGGRIATAVLAVPFDVGRPRAYVPILIEIDGPSLMSGQQGAVLPTEIYAYAIGADGRVQDFFTQAMGLDLAKVSAALEQSGFKFWGQFELPPGSYTARVLVRNSQSGASGLEVFPFRVPDFAQAEAALLPPLFPEPQGKWLLGRQQQSDASSHPYPFLLAEAPFVPAARPQLRAEQPTQVSLVSYHFAAGEPAAVSGGIVGADGSRLGELAIRLDERGPGDRPGMVRYLATFVLPAIAPGAYRLEITLRDPATGAEQTTSLPVTIAG